MSPEAKCTFPWSHWCPRKLTVISKRGRLSFHTLSPVLEIWTETQWGPFYSWFTPVLPWRHKLSGLTLRWDPHTGQVKSSWFLSSDHTGCKWNVPEGKLSQAKARAEGFTDQTLCYLLFLTLPHLIHIVPSEVGAISPIYSWVNWGMERFLCG